MQKALPIAVIPTAGGAVFRVAAGVGGNLSVVRDFKTREEAERFARPKGKGSATGQKRG
jgi:hypothetical protein